MRMIQNGRASADMLLLLLQLWCAQSDKKEEEEEEKVLLRMDQWRLIQAQLYSTQHRVPRPFDDNSTLQQQYIKESIHDSSTKRHMYSAQMRV